MVHWVNCFDLIKRLKPTVWACESVRGVYSDGRQMIDDLARQGMAMGYKPTYILCNALEHGVPQKRLRFFLVLSKVQLDWQPTHLNYEPTVERAWKGRKFKTETILETKGRPFKGILKLVKPGEKVREVFDRRNPDPVVEDGRIKGRPGYLVSRLRMDRYAPVVLGGGEFVHPTKHRFLSTEEQAALCGYPEGYTFTGGPSSQFAQIGRAVLPPVAKYLARIVAIGIRRNKKPLVMVPEEVTILRDKIETRDVDLRPKSKVPLRVEPPAVVKTFKETSRPGVGKRIRELLLAGDPTARILETIRAEFPNSKATSADVSWNKRKLAGKE